MSEVKDGIIGMPFELAMGTEISRRQFHGCAVAEITRLRAELECALGDQADEVIAEDLSHALANIPRYEGVSATECEECGEDIPEDRREAVKGATTCFECGSRLELAKKGVRRV